MAQISQSSTLSTTSLVVPDLYVQIVAPQTLTLNGVPSNLIGMVGTASWGAVNQPVVFGTMAQYEAAFGPVVNRKYDMGTPCACAVQQGATAFVGVRVSDGTDQAANYALLYDAGSSSYPLLLTAIYTGSRGNAIALSLGAGSKAGTWRLTLQMPGQLAESFDNLDPSGGDASFWQNVASAVNNGIGAARGPSALCVASVGTGASTIAPSLVSSQTLLNGSDGAASIASSSLVGQDGVTRSGMYALRGQGCSIGVLADCDDSSQWSIQTAFGQGEGCYMIVCGPSGDTISNAIAVKEASGVDSYAMKLMFGDWLYWYDQANLVTRLVSPQGFVAGRLGNLSPEQSSLNKILRT